MFIKQEDNYIKITPLFQKNIELLTDEDIDPTCLFLLPPSSQNDQHFFDTTTPNIFARLDKDGNGAGGYGTHIVPIGRYLAELFDVRMGIAIDLPIFGVPVINIWNVKNQRAFARISAQDFEQLDESFFKHYDRFIETVVNRFNNNLLVL